MLVNDNLRRTDFPLKEDKHYMVYKSVTDMLDKIQYLLDNREETIKRGMSAKKEAMKYPMSLRVKEMIKKCNLGTST